MSARLESLFEDLTRALWVAPIWRAIDTAPKTGESVLLFSAADQHVSEGFWNTENDCGPPEGWRYKGDEKYKPEPSHWMPMPLPPATVDDCNGEPCYVASDGELWLKYG